MELRASWKRAEVLAYLEAQYVQGVRFQDLIAQVKERFGVSLTYHQVYNHCRRNLEKRRRPEARASTKRPKAPVDPGKEAEFIRYWATRRWR